MNENTINVLLIEDNPRDVDLIEKMLMTAGAMAFNLTYTDTLATGLEQLASGDVDLTLLDLGLADSEGLDTLTQVQAQAPDIPVVVLTGLDDEASGLKAVQQGAQDYLMKNEANGPLLQRAIRYALERHRMAKTLQRHMDHLEGTVAARTAELRQTNAQLRCEIAERERMEQALKAQTRALQASERKLERMLNTILDGMVMVDPEGKIIYANPAAEQILEVHHDTILNRYYSERTWQQIDEVGDPYPQNQLPLALALGQQREVQELEHGIIAPDEEVKWLSVNAAPLLNGDGQLTGAVASFRDITERKRAEQALAKQTRALEESEARFRGVFEQAAVGIAIVSPDEIMLEVNQKLCDMLGYTKEELLALTVQDITHPEDFEREQRYVLEVLANEREDFNIEKRYVHKQGHTIWANLSSNVIRDENGNLQFVVGVVVDITAQKRAKEALRESERNLDEAQRIAHLGSWEVDFATETTQWSDEFFRICGYEPDVFEPTLEKSFQLIHPDDREAAAAALRTSLEEGAPYHVEKRIIRPDGEVRHVLAKGEVVRDSAGQPRKLVGTFLDITERKQSEQALQESEARLRQAHKLAKLGHWDWYMDTNALIWSREVYQIFGQDPKTFQPTPKHLESTIHPDDLARFLAEREYALQHDTYISIEHRIIQPNGDLCYVEELGEIMRDAQGNVIQVRGTVQDITARKRAEEERQRYATALERSNAAFKQFAHIVSHDLKAPLRMVKSFLELLSRHYGYDLNAEAHEYIQFAMDGATQMMQLIDALLKYARIDSRGQEPVPTDAEEILAVVLHILQFDIQEKGAEVTHNPLPTVRADPTQLKQLFQNLIGNALKFCDQQQPQVHIDVEHRDGAWVFSVQDNGIGIAEQDQARVFEIFDRLHTQEEYEGTGIGLAVCKKIVERHGGQIWVKSEVGEGSTFYFTLPAVEGGNTTAN